MLPCSETLKHNFQGFSSCLRAEALIESIGLFGRTSGGAEDMAQQDSKLGFDPHQRETERERPGLLPRTSSHEAMVVEEAEQEFNKD